MGSIALDIKAGNEYKLPRGGREAVRLTAQHHVMTTRQGWLLHPTVADAIKDMPRPRIVDVATGTGIWAMDLAQQMPRADIVGLDISDKQFPADCLLPSNVTLGIYDLLSDVPTELQGTFDIVHVRLLLAAGPAVDKKIFIDRFRSLLRPGGWLQWDDLAYPTCIACFPSLKIKGHVDTVDMSDHPIIQAFTRYLGMDSRNGWFPLFEKIMSNAGGFVNMTRYPVPIQPHLLQMETDLLMAVSTDLMEMVIHNKNIDDPVLQCEIRGAAAKMSADIDDGVLFSYNWNTCIASKA